MKDSNYEKMFKIESTHWWFKVLHELVLFFAKEHSSQSAVILDAGCGTGQLLSNLQSLAIVEGFDFSEKALSLCEQRNLKNIQKVDLNTWDPPKNKYDLIVSLDVVSDKGVIDDEIVLKKFHMALKSTGILILNLPAFSFLRRSHDEAVSIRKRYTRSDILALCTKTSFRPHRITYRLSFAFPIFILLRFYQRMINRNKEPSSDLFSMPSFLNFVLLLTSRIENFFIKSGATIPLGTSIFTILRKN